MNYLKNITKIILILLPLQASASLLKASAQSKLNQDEVKKVEKELDNARQRMKDTYKKARSYFKQTTKEHGELKRGVLEAEASDKAHLDSIRAGKMLSTQTEQDQPKTQANSLLILFEVLAGAVVVIAILLVLKAKLGRRLPGMPPRTTGEKREEETHSSLSKKPQQSVDNWTKSGQQAGTNGDIDEGPFKPGG